MHLVCTLANKTFLIEFLFINSSTRQFYFIRIGILVHAIKENTRTVVNQKSTQCYVHNSDEKYMIMWNCPVYWCLLPTLVVATYIESVIIKCAVPDLYL